MTFVWPQAGLLYTILACGLLGVVAQPDSLVSIERDNIKMDTSCDVAIPPGVVRDEDGNGVIHIVGHDITIDFEGATLRGADAETLPNAYQGEGVRITGTNVTVRNLNVRGYKVGIHAIGAHHLTLENCDVSDNFRQRLGSTPEREDAGDWLWPHKNDGNEWITNYGAGVCIEDSNEVTLRRIRARHVQNGIILDRVNDSFIYDNDCSFLSGWGIALWRSNFNHITRNAFDFCIRGYSHGVYNRGQDSAGLLMFEQCDDNIIVKNSITHGGDGIFAFSGKEALGEDVEDPNVIDLNWYRGRGNRRNIILSNDCSYAAAHGVELTFGFDNSILANRLVDNAICGVWGGYSHRSIIAGNTIESNGAMAYGLERGGVNIEHGMGNWVQANHFASNKCGVHLWWDKDEAIAKLPWARVNTTDASRNVIYGNTFVGDALAIHLRATERTFIIDNTMTDVGKEMESDDYSDAGVLRDFGNQPPLVWNPPPYEAQGMTSPVGARTELRGRDKIIMTEWGPYDWEAPMLRYRGIVNGADHYEMLGASGDATCTGNVMMATTPEGIFIRPKEEHEVTPYTVSIRAGEETVRAKGVIMSGHWTVTAFPSPNDPREDVDAWRMEGTKSKDAVTFRAPAIDFTLGGGGYNDVQHLHSELPHDHFGTIATRTLTFPKGTWRIRTTSDDGIRVWLDDALVIDDWTWHAPKEDTYEFTVEESTSIDMRVEHFELDGYAVLKLAIERVE